MRITITLLMLLLSVTSIFAQKRVKPRLQTNYYNFSKTQPESRGYFYADDFTGETTLKHGKWTYWNKKGVLVEIRNYQKGTLNGEVISYYFNGNIKNLGYFKMGVQDSISKVWYLNRQVKTEGAYKMGRKVDVWNTYYITGYHEKEETYEDSIVFLQNYWTIDSTQTVKNGNGETYLAFSNNVINEKYTYKDGLENSLSRMYMDYI